MVCCSLSTRDPRLIKTAPLAEVSVCCLGKSPGQILSESVTFNPNTPNQASIMRASTALAVATAALSSAPACALDNGAAPLPPRGWSSWNSFKLDINEDVVKSSADIMAAELLSSGYEYLLIDDGWPPDSAHYKGKGPARLPDGTIPVSAEKFPSGFKNLTDCTKDYHSQPYIASFRVTDDCHATRRRARRVARGGDKGVGGQKCLPKVVDG